MARLGYARKTPFLPTYPAGVTQRKGDERLIGND
jgi:hypothetical protein